MMQFQNQNDAFSSGTPLWIIADLESSLWAKKLDWYLNFQLRRARLHQSPSLSEHTKQKLSDWGFTAPEMQSPAATLMIASAKLLPNEFTVQIKTIGKSNHEKWASECLKLIQNLQVRKARIFLPAKMTPEDFKSALRKTAKTLDTSNENEMTFEFVTEDLIGDLIEEKMNGVT